MLSFLGQVSPNTWAGLLGLAVTFGTWLWHDIRGDQKDSLLDNLKGLGKQAIHVLVVDPAVTAAIDPMVLQSKAKGLLLQLAAAAKIPTDNALTQAIADQVAQHVVGDVLAELRALEATYTSNLQKLAASAAATARLLQTFKPAEAFEGSATVQPDGTLKRDPLPAVVRIPSVPGDVQSPK